MTSPYDSLFLSQKKKSPYDTLFELPSGGSLAIDDPDDNTPEEPESFVQKAWDLGKFLREPEVATRMLKLISNPSSALELGSKTGVSMKGELGKAFLDNANKSWEDVKDVVFHRGVGNWMLDTTKDVGNSLKAMGSDPITTLGSFGSGLLDFFVETNVEALTGYKNSNGQAVEMTPEEYAQTMQTAVANVANFMIQRGIAGKMLKAPTGIKAARATKLGNLGKVVAANAVGGTVSSIASEPLSQLGQDDYLTKVVSNVLSSASAGTVLGSLFDYRGYNKRVADNVINFKESLNELANARAAAAFLQNGAEKSPAAIVASIDAVLGSDDLTEAAIRAGLHGRGFVVPSLSVEKATEILGKIQQAPIGVKEYHMPNKFVSKLRPTYSGVPISWENQFDLVAYHAQASGFQKNPELMADVMAKTGVSKEQLIAHGKAVVAKLKEMDSAGLYANLTQGEIEFLESGYLEKGKKLVTEARNGEELVDFNNRKWVKDGDSLVSGDLRVPANGNTVFMSFGRTAGSVNPAGNRKLIVPKQQFQGDYNRNVETVNITHGPNGEAYVSVDPLNNVDRELFERTGFLSRETVYALGDTEFSYVSGFDENARKILNRIEKLDYESPEAYKEVSKAYYELDDYLNGSSDIGVTVKFWDDKAKAWKTKVVPSKTLARINNSLVASNNAEVEGFNTKQTGVLDNNNLANQLIDDVTDNYVTRVVTALNKNPDAVVPTFEDVFLRSAKDLGISESQANALRDPIYRRIDDHLKSNYLSPEDAHIYSTVQKGIENLVMREESSVAGFFNQLIHRNGYYFIDNGSSIEIRDITGDSHVATVADLRQGVEFLATSGRQPIPGFNGKIPDTVHLGNLATKLTLRDTKMSQIVDLVNTNTHAINFVPIRNLWSSVSNNLERLGVNNTVFKFVEDLNDSLARRRMFFTTHKGLIDDYRTVIKMAEGLDSGQLDHINRAMQTMNAGEIVQSYLARPMNSIEQQAAQDFAKRLIDANETVSAINNAYLIGVKAGRAGSVDFRQAVSSLLSNKMIDPKVSSVVMDFVDLMNMHGKDNFSPHAVLKLTHAIQFPAQAKSLTDYLKTSGISPQAAQVVAKLKDLFRDAGNIAGIPEADKIGAYLPQIKQMDSFDAYHQIKVPEGFARELNRVLSGRDDVISNPLSLAYMYIQSVANESAGTSRALKNFHEHLFDESNGVTKRLLDYDTSQNVNNIKTDVGRKQAEFVTNLYSRYHDALLGYPDVSDKARGAFRSLGAMLLGKKVIKNFESGSLLALVDSAFVGARPVQAIRDIGTSIGVSYQIFGAEFTRKALIEGMSFNKKLLENMEADLKIPRTLSHDFLAPDTDYATGVAMGVNKSKTALMQDIGMRLSGQHYVYARTLAGIYKHTQDLVYEQLGKAKRQEITLEKAIENLQIEVHNPAVQRQFLAYANSGDIEGAARLLGKWNGKIVANNYGEMQSPLTWRKGIGKFAGQFGSWGVNMMQTQLDAVRGVGGARKSYKRLARLAAFTGAVAYAGKEAGIDMSNILFTPVQAAPGAAPILQLYFDMQEAGNDLFSPDESRAKRGMDAILRNNVPFYPKWTDVGKWYIPGSYAMRDILRATEAWNDGNDPFVVAGKAVGIKFTQQ